MKVIAIDNGHGYNTAGKRTPTFPSTNKVIREWEFNHATARRLKELLENEGYKVVMISDTTEDTPLNTRVVRANNERVDLYISIHYNALTGVWGTQGGIETFHFPSSSGGKKLAETVQKELIESTGLRNRGVKSANFYVLKNTKMPSILIEAGFMDNLAEASLMLDVNYQMKVAKAILNGVNSYFGVVNKPIKVVSKAIKIEKKTQTLKLDFHGKTLEVEGIIENNTNYIPVRTLELLGYEVSWDKDNKIVIVDYKTK